jgi:hypothetical protein
MEIVEYRDVVGYPGYRVGSDGTIWSRHRIGGKVLHSDWALKAPRCKSGYLYVGLYRERKTQTVAVHRLVLEAFVGPRPQGMQCRHRDGDPRNNRRTNLTWGTPQQNSDDKLLHGTFLRGSNISSAKLTESQVLEIRDRRRSGEKLRVIAAEFGVHNATVSRVCTSRQWVHV